MQVEAFLIHSFLGSGLLLRFWTAVGLVDVVWTAVAGSELAEVGSGLELEKNHRRNQIKRTNNENYRK